MRFIVAVLFVYVAVGTAHASPPIELELATERGVQITAPHEWLQLLTSIGVDNVRIRGARPGDEPQVENRGAEGRPRYYVLGLLSARDQLRLPGGAFTRGDRAGLKDYFDRLEADGDEALTAVRGMFGLTKKEIEAVFADLAQPIAFDTTGQTPSEVLERVQSRMAGRFQPSAEAKPLLHAASPIVDELQGLTAGTGVAIMLRSDKLVLRPEKPRGQPVMYRIMPADEPVARSAAGRPDDHEITHWPIGWQPQQTPGQMAPSLFEFLNAEIDGYTLEETLAAIRPRVKVPLYLDHAALAAHGIEPSAVKVRIARTRTFYKRLLDRVLSQARLGSELRVDEAGRPFVWITR